MTLNDLSKIIALVITALAALVTVMYALTDQRREAKKILRLFESMVFLWLVAIYASAICGNNDPLFLAGLYTRSAVIALSGLFVGEVLSDWKKK